LQKIEWSEEYLILAEENFDKVFKNMYEKEFIDHIFLQHESFIKKEDFVTAIAGTLSK
jgi:hypothetical protein